MRQVYFGGSDDEGDEGDEPLPPGSPMDVTVTPLAPMSVEPGEPWITDEQLIVPTGGGRPRPEWMTASQESSPAAQPSKAKKALLFQDEPTGSTQDVPPPQVPAWMPRPEDPSIVPASSGSEFCLISLFSLNVTPLFRARTSLHREALGRC